MAAIIASGLVGLLAGIIIGCIMWAPAEGYTGPVGEWKDE